MCETAGNLSDTVVRKRYSSTFLVALDEARELVCPCRRVPDTPSQFLQWRSWLSTSGTWSSAFFLLLDTTLIAANVAPPEPIDDPSARIVPPGVQLLRPIFEFPFLGPWPLPRELQTFLLQRSLSSTVVPPSAWSTTTDHYQPLVDVFRFSRPMYLYVRPNVGLTENTPIDDLMGEVLSMAQRKLFTTTPEATLVHTVAVCYRYGLRPYQLALQDTLLDSHSATLTAMGPDGSLDVRYLPEPMVGEALSCWLPATCLYMAPRSASQMKLKTLLEHLRSALRSRQLRRSATRADRGALATSVYLLHAYEEATRLAASTTAAAETATRGAYRTFSGLLRVQDWVSALAGLPLSAASELSEGAGVRLTRGLASAVSFTGCTVAQEPITDRTLQYAWCHRVGYLCDDRESAVALVLPLVRCPSAVANATPSADATVGKKRALDEKDAATEARTVKRFTSATRSTIRRGSPPPTTANVIPAAPTARRMPSRGDENKDDTDEDEGEPQPTTRSTSPHAHDVEEQETTKQAMAELEAARHRGFLPDRCAGLSAVAIQVAHEADDIDLGDAYRCCRLQADRLRDTANVGEDVLSVLCMTGSGRVVSLSLPSTASPEGVLLFVEEPQATSSGGDGSTFVGLVVNGFDERLVGVDAKAQLEALSAQVSDTGTALEMYQQEHMDAALAQRYALVCQQQGARLPGHFGEAADAQPAAPDAARSATSAAASTTNPSEQPLTWTHRLVSVTSETLKRTLRVYSLESVAR